MTGFLLGFPHSQPEQATYIKKQNGGRCETFIYFVNSLINLPVSEMFSLTMLQN